MDDTPSLFDAIAHGYDRWSRILSANGITHWRAAALKALDIQSGNTVLDIGCGTGTATYAMARQVIPGGEVIGLDPSPEMLAKARRERPAQAGNIQWRLGVAEELPLEDHRVDRIAIFFALRNMKDWRQGLMEAQRVLRPGGRLTILEMLQPSTTRAVLAVRALEAITAPFRSARMEPFRWLPRSLLHAPTATELSDHIVGLNFMPEPRRQWLGGLVTMLSGTLGTETHPLVRPEHRPTVVVWASDGSDPSLQAGMWIRGHLPSGTIVHLVTVQPPSSWMGAPHPDDAVRHVDALAWQRDLARSQAVLKGRSLIVQSHLILGSRSPATEIVQLVETIHPDLVVLGKKPRDAGARLLWGDVGYAVVHHTDIPVLLVPESGLG